MAAASTTFKHLPAFLFLLLLSSAQIEARANKFFSKFTRTDHNDVVLPLAASPAPVSAPPEISPSLAPTPFFDESQNAYGLYGRDNSDDGESSRTITDVEEEILAEDGEESYRSGYPKTNSRSESYGGGPRRYEQYQSNYENNNGYRNYQYQSNFEDGGYRRSRSEATEREGMSDTRFMENGRYYHDINSRNNGGEEEEGGESYGSKKNQNEFDSMEEYEKSEEFRN